VSTSYQQIRHEWLQKIHQMGLQQVAVTLLEASGPLNLAAAQLVYIGQPLLRGLFAEDQLTALAQMLEEPAETAVFVDNLQEIER
jgi:hypothetical protein